MNKVLLLCFLAAGALYAQDNKFDKHLICNSLGCDVKCGQVTSNGSNVYITYKDSMTKIAVFSNLTGESIFLVPKTTMCYISGISREE